MGFEFGRFFKKILLFTATRYCAGKQTKFGWDATGQSNLNELNLLLCRKFMIRRTKDEVMTELGEKHRFVLLFITKV